MVVFLFYKYFETAKYASTGLINIVKIVNIQEIIKQMIYAYKGTTKASHKIGTAL